jgi:hypothetical protein
MSTHGILLCGKTDGGIHAIVPFLLKLIQWGVQVDAAVDSFNYCQSIVVLRQSLITTEEITIDRSHSQSPN